MAKMGLLRENLIESLSDEEIAALVRATRSITRDNIHVQGADFLRTLSAKNFFGFLHFKVFGSWVRSELAAERVVESIGKVKEVIQGLPLGQIQKTKNECPEMPHGLCINNEIAGTLFVTRHAWERFIERWSKNLAHKAPAVIARALQKSFARALPNNLPKGYAALRIMSNDFKPSEYYLDRSIRCRFVVVIKEDKKILFTVERPYS